MKKEYSTRTRGARKTSGHNWTSKNIMRQQPPKRQSTTNNLLSQSEKQKALLLVSIYQSHDKRKHHMKPPINNLDQLTVEPLVHEQLSIHKNKYNTVQLETQRIKEKKQREELNKSIDYDDMFNEYDGNQAQWHDADFGEDDPNANGYGIRKTKKRKPRRKKSQKNRKNLNI